ncbi:hypothetical protein [Streptomyces sp. NPDC020951]|uniref:hypothetical protein n=1 Tax=Streptomyces sp. NPDC020951 TaxID=3365104 RepID=UPI00379F6905
MIALETFTVRELAVVSGVGTKTVQTVVKRERERLRVEEVARVPATGRGNRAKVYRIVPDERPNVEKDLRELEQTRRLLQAASASAGLDDGERDKVPGAFLAAEHVLLHQLPGETDHARRRHLIDLAELSIIDGFDGGAVSQPRPAGTVAQAHAAAARFLLHLAEAEQEVTEGPAGQWARLQGLQQTFEAVVAQVAAEDEKALERAMRERFQASLRRHGTPTMQATPDPSQRLKTGDIMEAGKESASLAARHMRDPGVGALPVGRVAGDEPEGMKSPTGVAVLETVHQQSTIPTVLVYEDDPGFPPQVNMPVPHPVPQLDTQPFPTAIAESAPQPDSAGPGTEAFRYWVAADALSRGSRTWGPLVPAGTQWHPRVGSALTAHLNAGNDLNAFYDRTGLWFFRRTVAGVLVAACESSEVVEHATGHAILDALRPSLFNAASAEVAALHEAFGDISALLSSLRLESLRIGVLTETQGDLELSSRVSRMAEQMGWAIRQGHPNAVDPDCLRNLSNRFFYRDPVQLPPNGPANTLSSEPHSFSRVFSGAFLKIVAGIFRQQDLQDEAGLARAAETAGQLLVDAAVAAPIVSAYYAQVAGHMIAADQRRNGGRNGRSLRSAFIRHGILSLEAAASIIEPEVARRGAGIAEATSAGADDEGLTDITVHGATYGVTQPLILAAPAEERGFGIAGSQPAGGSVSPADPERVAKSYLEDLFRRGRVHVPEEHRSDAAFVDDNPSRLKTHEITRNSTGEGLALVRQCFD